MKLCIGNAYTEMTSSIALSALQPNGERKPEPTFDAKHVADVIVHIASLPTSVSIPEMTIMYVHEFPPYLIR